MHTPPRNRVLRLLMRLRPQQADSLRTPGYEQYMRSDRWRSKKREFRKWWETNKGPYRCWHRWCFRKDALDVHHVDYDSFGDEEYDDLVPLCRKHHNRVTQAWKRERTRTFGPRRTLRQVTHQQVRAFVPPASRADTLRAFAALVALLVMANRLI